MPKDPSPRIKNIRSPWAHLSMSRPNHFKKIKEFLINNLDLNNLFKYNLMTKDIEFTRKLGSGFWHHEPYLTDEDLVHVKDYISEIMNEEFNKTKIEEVVLVLAKCNSYHPIRDYLKGLEWDGIERLDFWLHRVCGAENNHYTRDVGRKILCGAVARIINPGCKFDYMLILEGEQGLGKSTMLEILGGEWYLDTHFHQDKKDMVDVMRTAWILEIADMAGFNKSDIQHLRSFITRKTDRVRLPYEKRSKDFPRQCIMIGTHNPSGDNQYFRDDTGNRRYWTVECNKIDIDLIKEWKDQLFAEALVKYTKGEKLYLDNSESLEILKSMHEKREIRNPWDELISRYIIRGNKFTVNEIIEGAFDMSVRLMNFRELRSRQTAVGIYMKKIGWVKKGDYYVKESK